MKGLAVQLTIPRLDYFVAPYVAFPGPCNFQMGEKSISRGIWFSVFFSLAVALLGFFYQIFQSNIFYFKSMIFIV